MNTATRGTTTISGTSAHNLRYTAATTAARIMTCAVR